MLSISYFHTSGNTGLGGSEFVGKEPQDERQVMCPESY